MLMDTDKGHEISSILTLQWKFNRSRRSPSRRISGRFILSRVAVFSLLSLGVNVSVAPQELAAARLTQTAPEAFSVLNLARSSIMGCRGGSDMTGHFATRGKGKRDPNDGPSPTSTSTTDKRHLNAPALGTRHSLRLLTPSQWYGGS